MIDPPQNEVEQGLKDPGLRKQGERWVSFDSRNINGLLYQGHFVFFMKNF